ncbi:MAG: hypothetical protein H0T73_20765, partial [Ardenticatenales bacterium]|nr:hypothetical protein [Ardenticatenales bacterium]
FETVGNIETLKFIQQQAKQRPEDLNIAKFMGEVQKLLGDNEGAAKSWERAVELLVRKGERSQASALLRQMIVLKSRQEKRYRTMLDHLTKQ